MRVRFSLFAAFLVLAAALPAPGQAPAWKLRVAADSAAVRLEPDLKSPVMTTLAKGTTLNSSEAVGAWYRVFVPPARDGVSFLGYIASNEVEVIEERVVPPRDFWAPTEDEFQGLGYDLVLGGGLTFFGSGDLASGVSGRYDALASLIQGFGYSVTDKRFGRLGSGVQATAEVIRDLDGRFAWGVGVDYLSARRHDSFVYTFSGIMASAHSGGFLKAWVLRPKLHYTIPLSKTFSVRLNAGPALFLASFDYDYQVFLPTQEESFYQSGRKAILGAQGAAALEVRVNSRTAFVLQASGRYGRTKNLTGTERTMVLWNGLDRSGPEISGSFYFFPGGPFPSLAVRSEPPAGPARKATADFSGVDLTFGLRVKF